MHFLRITQNKQIKSGLSATAILLLLVIYLAGTVEISSFHAILHNAQDARELHSAVNETNSCHQSIYHNKKDKSCEHKSHIIANKSCDLCQLFLESFHFASTKPADFFVISLESQQFETSSLLTSATLSYLTPRAPPHV